GLHQPIFHPMFVFCFLNLLYLQRRWKTFAFYTLGYLLILAFWFSWPGWISLMAGGPLTLPDPGTPNYFTRLTIALQPMTVESVWLTVLNILRFITWQHLLLLPLMAVGLGMSWKRDRLAQAIANAFFLPIIVIFIVLPY